MVNDRAGNLWFATMNGISRFDGTKFTTIRPSSDPVANNVNMIAEEGRGNFWLALFGGGVCRIMAKILDSIQIKTDCQQTEC